MPEPSQLDQLLLAAPHVEVSWDALRDALRLRRYTGPLTLHVLHGELKLLELPVKVAILPSPRPDSP
jgi:hypothetical protein